MLNIYLLNNKQDLKAHFNEFEDIQSLKSFFATTIRSNNEFSIK